MKFLFTLILIISIQCNIFSQVKILFDATKAETAGSADWIIDADVANMNWNPNGTTSGSGYHSNAQRYPTPAQSGITASTPESYWKGALSYWAIDCVKKGYTVETLPYTASITYGNSGNAQDLSNYNIYVVDEPNILFTAAEKTAILNFVKNGGSLFMISDHTVSDRNNDGHDSPEIWNDLMSNNTVQTNPFGFSFDLVNISGSSTNISTYASDSLLYGPAGNVSQVLWSNGTTMTINTTVNPTVKAAVYKKGSSNTGSTNVMVAYARYGKGKVVAFGDSSPFDDGTGNTNSNVTLYDGYITDAAGNHQKIIMNATIWLAIKPVITPVDLISFNGNTLENGNNLLYWNTANEINAQSFIIQQSLDGREFTSVGEVAAKGKGTYQYTDYRIPSTVNGQRSTVFYRLMIRDNDGSYTFSKIIVIKSENRNLKFEIAGNPVKNELVLTGISNSLMNTEASLINSNGIIVKRFVLNGSNQTINVSSLSKGIYYLRTVDGNRKIVVSR